MSKLGEDFCVRLYSTSPAPKRDYQGLTITTNAITLYSWDISHGPHIYPRRQHMCLEDFCDDNRFQAELSVIFGPHVVEYILRLARGEKHFHFLPEKLVLKILNMLAVNDILNLRQTSKIFFQICNTSPVWKILFRKRLKRPISVLDTKQAQTMPWQYMLRKTIERTNNPFLFKHFMKNVYEIAENMKFDSNSSTFSSKIADGLLLKSKDDPKFRIPKYDFILKDHSTISKNENSREDNVDTSLDMINKLNLRHKNNVETQIKQKSVTSKQNSDKINIKLQKADGKSITNTNKKSHC